MSRTRRRPTMGWILAGLVVAAGLAEVGLARVEPGADRHWSRPWQRAAYALDPTAADRFREHRRLAAALPYLPYLEEGLPDAAGREASLAGTERPLPGAVAGAPELWCFGGSLMWGYGATAEESLPSLLAQRAEAAGQPLCVRNFAVPGAVSSQQLLGLLLRLRDGGRPALVLFCAGLDDALAALDPGAGPGLPRRHAAMARVSGDDPFGRLLHWSWTESVGRSRLAGALARTPRWPAAEVERRLGEAAAIYRGNLDTARRLGEVAGDGGCRVWSFFPPVCRLPGEPVSPGQRLAALLAADPPPGWMDLSSAPIDPAADQFCARDVVDASALPALADALAARLWPAAGEATP